MTSDTLAIQDRQEVSSRSHLPVVVGVDDSPDSALAVAWATYEARTRGVPLTIVRGYTWETDNGANLVGDDVGVMTQLRQASERVAWDAARRARLQDPDLEIRCAVAEEYPPDLLIEQSANASLVVVGTRGRGAVARTVCGSVSSAVAGRAGAPVIVVCGAPPIADEPGQVVVGVKPDETAPAVLAYAFEHAQRHGLSVQAILCWRATGLADARMMPDRARRSLSGALAGWREHYPDVPLTSAAVHEEAAGALVRRAANSRLLVVGRHGCTPRLGQLLGSVSQAVIHHATRPVAVVPVWDND
jgi:nucleotide-binding universal stress UspA family protein